MSIARCAGPGLFSRPAQSELESVYCAGPNWLDIETIGEDSAQTGLSWASHQSLDISESAPACEPAQDVFDAKKRFAGVRFARARRRQ